MGWDPTDYKDMLDDDWNDRHQDLIEMLDEEFFSGVYVDEMLKKAEKILGNPKVIGDKEFERLVDTQEADIEELAKYLMDNFYLTPMARKRARMKNESKQETFRAKTINESNDSVVTSTDRVKNWWNKMDHDQRLEVGSLAVKHNRMSPNAKWNCYLEWDKLLTSQKKTLVYMNSHINDYRIKESLNEDTWKSAESEIEPWGKNMKLMDKMLDKFEQKYGSLEESSWEEIQLIKKALWLGYNTGKGKESSWQPVPPVRDQEGNTVSDWRGHEMGQ